MPIIQRWNDQLEGLGQSTGNFIKNSVTVIRDGVCNLWDKYPSNWVVNPYSRGFMNSICNYNEDGNSSNVLDFGRYKIVLKYRFLPKFETEFTEFRFHGVFGEGNPYVGSIASIDPVILSGGQTVDHKITNGDGIETTYTVTRLNVGSGNVVDEPTLEYIITPVPPDFNPEVIDPGDINYNTDITTHTVNNSPVTENFDVNIEIEGDNSIKLPAIVNIGGVNFNFGIDGISVNFGDGAPVGDDGGGSGGGGGKFPPPTADDFDEEEKTEEDQKEETVGIQLDYVQVELTTIPTNAKSQWGDGAPDVYYAGWFEFTTEGYNYNRVPIHFQNSVFRAPDGATGYAYTLYNGFQGRAIVYKRKEE